MLWSLTRAPVKLLLFQDHDLSYSRPIQPVITTVKIADTTQGEMSDEAVNNLSRLQETCKMLKIILSKLKLIKISESVIAHEIPFQHQLGLAMHLT